MKTIKLNLGCGRDIRPGFVNVDIEPLPEADMKHDLNRTPYPFKAGSAEYILMDNVLEHLRDPIASIMECARILQPGGVLHILVPYYNAVGAYNDLTHRHFFNEYTFRPFYEKSTRSNYGDVHRFKLLSLNMKPTIIGRLVPFDYVRRRLSIVLGEIVGGIDIRLERL